MKTSSMSNVYIGIDPGSSSGAIAVITTVSDAMATHSPGGELFQKEGMVVDCYRISKHTETELAMILRGLGDNYEGRVQAVIEKVSAMPKQGVSSTFKFGANFGRLMGFLEASRIPYELVLPTTWMKSYSMKKNKGEVKGAWKRRLMARAQQLFPTQKIQTDCGDAVLIAKYCKDHIKLI